MSYETLLLAACVAACQSSQRRWETNTTKNEERRRKKKQWLCGKEIERKTEIERERERERERWGEVVRSVLFVGQCVTAAEEGGRGGGGGGGGGHTYRPGCCHTSPQCWSTSEKSHLHKTSTTKPSHLYKLSIMVHQTVLAVCHHIIHINPNTLLRALDR